MMEKAPVDVWTVSLTEASASYLSPDELERAGRFKFRADRTRWTRARSALRSILSRYAGANAQSLSFVYGQHGKPALRGRTGIEFNLSHAGDWAIVAVAGSVPVGVDIERIRPGVDMAALLRRLGERELPETTEELYQRWTGREARSKAVGGALFDRPPENIHAVACIAPFGYSASVALDGYLPEVVYREA